MITWVAESSMEQRAPGCAGEIVNDDGRSILVCSDWDYPSVASSFGWSPSLVPGELRGRARRERYLHRGGGACEHRSTDGTVSCPECGLSAGDFISAAYEWLQDNDGATAEDPGYFHSEENPRRRRTSVKETYRLEMADEGPVPFDPGPGLSWKEAQDKASSISFHSRSDVPVLIVRESNNVVLQHWIAGTYGWGRPEE